MRDNGFLNCAIFARGKYLINCEKGIEMWTKESIEIVGYQNRHIKNKFYTHKDNVELLTIIVAGFRYTINAPYIYYSKYLPYYLNSDVLLIDLDYSQIDKFFKVSDKQKDEWFENDLRGIKESLASLSEYSKFWQIGKSLGTSVIFRLLEEPEILNKTEKIVWLTPGEKAQEIYSKVPNLPISSLIVYGSNDPNTKENEIKQIKDANNIRILTFNNADHSLETEDIEQSIEYLKIYVKELKTFFVQ